MDCAIREYEMASGPYLFSPRRASAAVAGTLENLSAEIHALQMGINHPKRAVGRTCCSYRISLFSGY